MRILLSLCALLFLLVSPVLAQTETPQSQLLLTVVDQTDAAVVGATVTVTRPDGSTLNGTTDPRGQVTLEALPTAEVHVQVEFPGFELFDGSLALRTGSNDATATLVIAGFEEEVLVGETTTFDDRQGNSLTTTLEESDIAELPDDPEEMAQVLGADDRRRGVRCFGLMDFRVGRCRHETRSARSDSGSTRLPRITTTPAACRSRSSPDPT